MRGIQQMSRDFTGGLYTFDQSSVLKKCLATGPNTMERTLRLREGQRILSMVTAYAQQAESLC